MFSFTADMKMYRHNFHEYMYTKTSHYILSVMVSWRKSERLTYRYLPRSLQDVSNHGTRLIGVETMVPLSIEVHPSIDRDLPHNHEHQQPWLHISQRVLTLCPIEGENLFSFCPSCLALSFGTYLLSFPNPWKQGTRRDQQYPPALNRVQGDSSAFSVHGNHSWAYL